MKVIAIHNPGELHFDEVEVPQAGANDVVVKVGACGICGSDIGYTAMGGFGGGPMQLGHELSGIIAQVGVKVGEFKQGQHVVVNPIAAGNMIGNGGPAGGFAPYLLVQNVTAGGTLYAVPDTLPFDLAALAEPLSVSLHAVNRAHVRAEHQAVVFGAGPVGLGVIIGLRRRGLKNIVAVDIAERKLSLAKKLGAHATVDASKENLREALIALHGSRSFFGTTTVGSDIYFDAAGAPNVIPQIIEMARPNANIMVVALHQNPLSVDLGQLMGKEISLLSAMGYGDEFTEAIEILTSGEIDVSPMISHRFDFADFMRAFETARDKTSSAKVMVTFAPDAN